jgi:hypothetical protein
MLQFSVYQSVNTNAVYPNIEATPGTTEILLDFTQSINNNTVTSITSSLVKTPTPWLIFQLPSGSVPTASGQYTVNIYQFSRIGGLGTWGSITASFSQVQSTWGGGNIAKGTLLSTERAYVSGSNLYQIEQYNPATSSIVRFSIPTSSIIQYPEPTSSYYYTYNYP